VHVALDRGHQDSRPGRDPTGVALLVLDVGLKVGHRLLHHTRALDHLRQEHLPRTEPVAHDIHAAHQGALDHGQRAAVNLPGFLRVLFDVIDDSLDQCMRQPFVDALGAPGVVLLPALAASCDLAGKGDESIGGIGAPVEQQIFHMLEQFGGDLVVDRQLPGVDDAHIHAGADRVVEEGRVHRLSDGVVAAEREGDVAHAAADLDPRKTLLQSAGGLDEGQRVVGVLLDSRADGQDVGVEDQVFRLESHFFGQDAIGPREDLDLTFCADRLALLVEGHHDHRCAVPADRPRL